MSLKKRKLRKNEREFIPKNIEKYVGQYPIIARSSWENRYCQWLDVNPAVLEWSSEGHCVRYIDPFQPQRKRRYFPDYYVCLWTNKGKRRYLVEIKPEKDLKLPPKKSNRSKKTLQIMETTYLVNQSKFKAAKDYCKKMGYEFKVITEKQLFRNKRG
jgi:hypothetical protein